MVVMVFMVMVGCINCGWIGAFLLKFAGKPTPIPIHVVASATIFIKFYFPTELSSPHTVLHNLKVPCSSVVSTVTCRSKGCQWCCCHWWLVDEQVLDMICILAIIPPSSQLCRKREIIKFMFNFLQTYFFIFVMHFKDLVIQFKNGPFYFILTAF